MICLRCTLAAVRWAVDRRGHRKQTHVTHTQVAATDAGVPHVADPPPRLPPGTHPIRPPPDTGPGITEALKRPHEFRTDPRLQRWTALAFTIRH